MRPVRPHRSLSESRADARHGAARALKIMSAHPWGHEQHDRFEDLRDRVVDPHDPRNVAAELVRGEAMSATHPPANLTRRGRARFRAFFVHWATPSRRQLTAIAAGTGSLETLLAEILNTDDPTGSSRPWAGWMARHRAELVRASSDADRRRAVAASELATRASRELWRARTRRVPPPAAANRSPRALLASPCAPPRVVAGAATWTV